jgi:putative SOS response-associated peptidase YedK
MCNYFTRHREPRNLHAAFKFAEFPNDPPRWVVRPTDTERVVAVGKDGVRHAIPMRWCLVPWWAKDIKTGLTKFNYRSEEFTDKPAFKDPWARGKRCLVPVDGFFEFTGEKGNKQPWLFKPADDRTMAFAGLWEQWKGPKHAPLDTPLTPPVLSFSIATTSPNATVAPIPPQLTLAVPQPPEGDGWAHELKFDGYRLHARNVGKDVRLLTRTGLDWTDKYEDVAASFAGLPAYYTEEGELIYAGRAGTGMDDKTLKKVYALLKPLEIKTIALSKPPPRDSRFGSPLKLSEVSWVKPHLVAQVRYLTWTADGLMRQWCIWGCAKISRRAKW